MTAKSFRGIVFSPGAVARLFPGITALFVVKESFPWIDYLFFPLFALFFIWAIIVNAGIKNQSGIPSRSYIFPYIMFLSISLVFLIAIFRSDLPVLDFKMEMLHLFTGTGFILTGFFILKTRDDFIAFRDSFFRTLMVISFLICLAGFGKFLIILMGFDLYPRISFMQQAVGTSLIADNDSFILPLVAAMFGVLFNRFRQKNHPIISISYHLIFLSLFYVVLWSGSKKGFVLALLIFLWIISLRIFYLLNHRRVHNYRLIRNLNILILVLGFSVLLGTWTIIIPNNGQKDRWLETAGFDRMRFKSEVTRITFAHYSTFSRKADMKQWYERLWGGGKYVSQQAMQDQIAFILKEQEKLAVSNDGTNWVERVYDDRMEGLKFLKEVFGRFTPREQWFGAGLNLPEEVPAIGNPPGKFSYAGGHWPNNYLLTALLYSGLTGILLILILFGQVVYICYHYRSELRSFLAIFLLASIFRMLSNNVLFSEPLILIAVIAVLGYRRVMLRDDHSGAIPENVSPEEESHDFV
jgi:hypothetical protein